MSQNTQVRLHYAMAQDLFQAFPNLADDISVQPATDTALDFLGQLRRSSTPEDAITYAAYLLPRRQAVWWGHQCVRFLGPLLDAQDGAMLELARAWVVEPEEPLRWRALEAGMAARDKTPGVWIC
ncbi:MAG TPA: hypothetical protein VL133_15555, partial [Devosia sp.]|nr:hypothetical protein [Devosia sp.]